MVSEKGATNLSDIFGSGVLHESTLDANNVVIVETKRYDELIRAEHERNIIKSSYWRMKSFELSTFLDMVFVYFPFSDDDKASTKDNPELEF